MRPPTFSVRPGIMLATRGLMAGVREALWAGDDGAWLGIQPSGASGPRSMSCVSSMIVSALC